MKYGKGTLTTIYDRVNFYRDVHADPHVTFKREGDKITLISGDGTIINDKLIAKTEDVFDHKFDTYTPLKKQLNPDQKIILEWLKNNYTGDADPFGTVACLFSQSPRSEVIIASLELTKSEQAQVLKVFSEWALEQEEE